MSPSINKLCAYLVSITALLTCQVAASAHDKLSFGGFASQGAVYTSDNTFFDQKKSFSTNMTELALQANYLFDHHWRFSGQTMYRHWGKSEGLLLDYLMADYQVALKNSSNLGLRVGRIKSDLGLVNATRDIPQARPSIFLPQSVYQDVLRDTTTSYDGLSIYGNQPLYQGRMSWSFAYGKYPPSKSLDKNILDSIFMATIRPKANIQLMATWESPKADWLFSLGYDNPKARLAGNDMAPVFIISDGEVAYDRYLLSTQYFSQNWDFTFEYFNQTTEIEGFEASLPGTDIVRRPTDDSIFTSDGFYGQFRYIFNEKLTLLTRYERYATDNSDRSGEHYYRLDPTYRTTFLRYHHDATMGLKWQINPQWLFHSEIHFIQGTAAIAPILKIDRSEDNDKSWRLVSAQLSYNF